MAFFDGDFFKGRFRKSAFFGGTFFQNSFFDDTTIAHGLTGGTIDPSAITVVCNRTITGTFDNANTIVTINGTDATTSGVASVGKDLNVTIAEVVNLGDVLAITFIPSEINNVGELTNEPILNNVVQIMALNPKLWDKLKPKPKKTRKKKEK